MTIIRPHKIKTAGLFILALAGVISTGGLLFIFSYNGIAAARQEIRELEIGLRKAEADESDLKNEVYRMTNLIDLELFAKEQGLVLDTAPQYLPLGRNLKEPSIASR